MTDDKVDKEYLAQLKEIDQKLYDHFLKFLKIGNFPETNQNFHLEI